MWRPSVAYAGWNPYYDGHWVYSDLGWTWVSDYEWGAVAYHYGTWDHDPVLGWVWIPGYVWAPSWVVFCSGPDYIGWAPVPVHYSVGVSVGFRDIGPDRFVIVPSGRFLSPRIRTVAVTGPQTRVVINKTKIVNRISYRNNVVVNHGPDVTLVEKAGGRKVKAVPIERVQRAAPGPRVRREELRAGPHRRRAAEPVSAKTPLPDHRGRDSRVEKARSDRREAAAERPAASPRQNTRVERRAPERERPAGRSTAETKRGRSPVEDRARVERSSPRGSRDRHPSAAAGSDNPKAPAKRPPAKKPSKKKPSQDSGKGDA